MNQSNGSNFVGNKREHHREIAVLVAKKETTPSASNLDVVEIAPHERVQQVRYEPIERIEFCWE
jgi:hypothetical protein